MHFVYRVRNSERELELRLGRPDATIGDLAKALGAGDGVLIDGRSTSSDTGVGESGLVAGSVVTAGQTQREAVERPLVVVRVIAGLEAGPSYPLPAGRFTVGRSDDADIPLRSADVSREHCALQVGADGTVMLTDLGSRNGTDLNGQRLAEPSKVDADDLVCVAGQVMLRVLPADRLEPVHHVNPIREARPGGTLPYNRAPRPALPSPGPEIALPAPPGSATRSPFSIAMIVGPMVLAGATVAITGNAAFALIALLSPLVLVGELVESRLRGRRSGRKGQKDYERALAETRKSLVDRRAVEVRRLRDLQPDPAAVLARAELPSMRLWESRPGAGDFLKVSVGLSDRVWALPLRQENRELSAAETGLITETARLSQVPTPVSIGAGGVIGLEGDRAAALAVARALITQACAGSGPADLSVAIFADADRVGDWDWAKWLPHTADVRSGSSRLVAIGSEAATALARYLLASGGTPDEPSRRVTLAVVDGRTLLEGRPCPLRELLAGATGSCGGIVLTDRLPALCTSVLTVTADGTGGLRQVTTGEQVDRIILGGMPERQARRTARALARFEDPELRVDGAGLPDQVNLLPLLELPAVSGQAIAQRWRDNAPQLRVTAVLGVTERDLFRIDLDDDGPHGLIAGTTGSGKSELLRTLIASMAIDTGPEQLTFALVDYKGGGALDECARLPHTVGLVTDLDEQLGERALRCLEAELKHREHALRDVGLSHVREYQKLRDIQRPELEPMPRLIVVIDEFATLVKALPDFVDSLVSIAQRGRSLGMHLIMATQRPQGSVSDAIKNNVKLRIALRLESGSDSTDVIDSPVSAGIGSRQWGRGYYRLSPRETLPVQTALSTGVTPEAAATAAITLSPFHLVKPERAESTSEDGPTDLQRLVAAAGEACLVDRIAPPRRPWPDPLPELVPLGSLEDCETAKGLQTTTPGLPRFALADDPDRQTQYPVGWDPEAGNLLIYGTVGSGATHTLAALALAVAGANPPDRQQIYVLDLGAGELAPLAGLPHTGAHIGAGERRRHARLIRQLRAELDARKAGAPQTPRLVLLDNLGALLSDLEKDISGMTLVEELARVFADGPAVRLHFAVTADRAGAVPGAWAALTQQKLLMRLADTADYGLFDVPRKAVPGFVPGRAVVAATHQVVQVGYPGDDLEKAVAETAARWPGAVRTAPEVRLLPEEIGWAELGARVSTVDEPWALPLGLGDNALAPAGLSLYEHEHAIIAGPSRSGRSSALCAIALSTVEQVDPPTVIAYAPRRSAVRELPAPMQVCTDLGAFCDLLEQTPGRVLALVDDAETVDDGLGRLDRWLAGSGAGRHLIAAGRADGIRRSYGGWLQRVRDGRTGVLLIPDYDLDGDLLGVMLPRHDRLPPLPGRGYLIANGSLEAVQLALPAQTGANP